MKHFYILILALIIGQQSFAQNNSEFDVFKKNILSLFDAYFENVEMSGEGKINLYATATYHLLPTLTKNTVIETVLSKSTANLAIVNYQYKSELWKKEPKNNRIDLIDTWDMNSITQTSHTNAPQKTNAHPWFFYLGAGGTFTDETDDNSSVYFSSRLGFFLLKNRWDLATTYTFSNTDNGDTSSSISNIGLMTKAYFPIKKINISPYIGTGISYIISDNFSNDTYEIPLYLGISWYVGFGNLDVGFQTNGENSIFTIGYTFSLWSK